MSEANVCIAMAVGLAVESRRMTGDRRPVDGLLPVSRLRSPVIFIAIGGPPPV